MNIKILELEKNKARLVISGEGHTFMNALTEEIITDPGVDVARYLIKFQFSDPELLVTTGLVAPLATGASPIGFYVEVLLGGLMAGVLYSLVALGFVLIFKASGVFNFAQGAMVLFAALAVARMAEVMPWWLATLLAVAIIVILAWLIERLVLRPLVNQEAIALLMATLGVTYFLDGFGQTVWGSDIYEINLGIAKDR